MLGVALARLVGSHGVCPRLKMLSPRTHRAELQQRGQTRHDMLSWSTSGDSFVYRFSYWSSMHMSRSLVSPFLLSPHLSPLSLSLLHSFLLPTAFYACQATESTESYPTITPARLLPAPLPPFPLPSLLCTLHSRSFFFLEFSGGSWFHRFVSLCTSFSTPILLAPPISRIRCNIHLLV